MSQQTAAFYNRFSFLYPIVDLVFKTQERILFSEVNRLPEGKLLEIGVGRGGHLHRYERHAVIGIDTSDVMLETARKNRKRRIQLMEMNGEALLFNDRVFDYVVLSHVVAVVDEPERLLREVHRVLKPGGEVLILNHFTPGNWLRYFDHAFQPVANLLRFRSVFRKHDLGSMENFTLRKEIGIGTVAYFKVLIYQKC